MDSERSSRRLRRRTLSRIAGAGFFAAGVGAVCPAWAQAESAASAGVAALERFVDDVETLSAQFTQELWSADQRLLEESAGTLSLKRPNRFYWHYEAPFETVVVADGESLWMYDVELEQVSVTPLEQMAEASPAMLLSGGEDLHETFDVAQSYSLDGTDWVKLTPKTPGGDFSSVLIGFGDEGLPRHLEYVDGLEQTTRIDFANVVVNAAVDDHVFEFEPPPGADVIGEL